MGLEPSSKRAAEQSAMILILQTGAENFHQMRFHQMPARTQTLATYDQHIFEMWHLQCIINLAKGHSYSSTFVRPNKNGLVHFQ